MEFKSKDLLDYTNLETLITTQFPNEKAKLISSKLLNYLFIQNSTLYILQKNRTYKAITGDADKHLMTMTTKLIELSIKSLSKDNQDLLRLRHEKRFKIINDNKDVKTYYDQLFIYLNPVDEVKFDITPIELHFNNGYIDLSTGELKQRHKKHRITKYIRRDYEPSTKPQRNYLKDTIINRIYPDERERNCILSVLGSALSGLCERDQTSLFLIGNGSSGKSTMLEITEMAIECYFKSLNSETFSQSSTKIDKIFNSYMYDPQIRISFINEPKDERMDAERYKAFIDGKCVTTRLYKEEAHTVYHSSKVITCANMLPNMKFDTGSKRRACAGHHKSTFVDDENKVDESKHIYLKNKNIKKEIIEKDLLNAWIDILVQKCVKWIGGKEIDYSCFKEVQADMQDGNDIIQDFIDGEIKLTDNPKDKIGKDEMHKRFSDKYPKKFLNVLQIITSLKEKGLIYNSQVRRHGVKGSFIGVRFGSSYNPEEIINECEQQKDDEKEELKKQIEELKRQVEEMKKQPKKKVVVEEPEPESLSDLEDIESETETDKDTESESDNDDESPYNFPVKF
jgi:phage/plasmid-associated DNA primase